SSPEKASVSPQTGHASSLRASTSGGAFFSPRAVFFTAKLSTLVLLDGAEGKQSVHAFFPSFCTRASSARSSAGTGVTLLWALRLGHIMLLWSMPVLDRQRVP